MNRRDTDREQTAAEAELACLTARQREVLVLVAKGYTSKDIARMTGMGQSTADDHRKNIGKALDCTIYEAVVTATRARWV